MKKFLSIICCCISLNLTAQNKKVVVVKSSTENKVDVTIDGKPFTSLIYPDNLEKPVLYPITAASGTFVTRGFPLKPRDGERTDHPHHIGYWLNYESVNGLDFWNNSYAIPKERKSKYGWIRNVKVTGTKSGNAEGSLSYSANWENEAKTILLKESTSFVFSGTSNTRTIDRVTTLTAQKDSVFFKDIKDGMLGLRVTKELEFASDKVEEFTDSQGNITKVPASGNGASGNYITSEGKSGIGVWATRGGWCMLKGIKDGKPLSVTLIDHPKNPGYPTYWHAREYGLFAANPLGQEIFSNGKEEMNLKLAPGQSVTFRYRMLITNNEEVSPEALNLQAIAFGKK
ncbi:MAG: PmoA family protein [Bacteroidota bacterium]